MSQFSHRPKSNVGPWFRQLLYSSVFLLTNKTIFKGKRSAEHEDVLSGYSRFASSLKFCSVSSFLLNVSFIGTEFCNSCIEHVGLPFEFTYLSLFSGGGTGA